MRIGIDLACWANRRGYGRYARELVRAMIAAASEERFACYLDEASAATFDLSGEHVEQIVVPQSTAPTIAARADGYRSPGDLLRFTRAVWRDRPDVFFAPSVYTYFPLPPGLRTVVAVHDAIADRFPELTLPSRRARLFWRLKVGLALRQARLVITVSEFARDELVEVLGVARDRIRVTGEAPADVYRPSESPDLIRAAAERVGVPAGVAWFIYVGGFNPHKRVDALVRAHAALCGECRDGTPHLVLVGSASEAFHSNVAEVRDAIRVARTDALVHWAGFVEDAELRHLLSGAIALVLPSVAEGFGLPAVEAAACGTPVIATTASPLPSLLAGGGLFVSPNDEPGLANAMRALSTDADARRAMGGRALAAAERMTWSHAADVALAALREVAR